MSNNNPIDKDRLYFTQFNDDFPVRCPICLTIKKIIRHCKVYRNFHAAWCHVKKDHQNEPESDVNRVKEIFNSLYESIKQGIIPYTTTSSSSAKNGTSFRRDMHEKLVKIAILLKGQSQSYPDDFRVKQLMRLIGVVLGPIDERTRKKYYDIIFSMSEKNHQIGTINVSPFCNTFGV